MSRASLSSDPPVAKQSTEPEIGSRLKRYLRADLQPGFRRHLLLKLQDPFAKGLDGGFKPSALWIGLGALGLLTLAGFVYFTFLRA